MTTGPMHNLWDTSRGNNWEAAFAGFLFVSTCKIASVAAECLGGNYAQQGLEALIGIHKSITSIVQVLKALEGYVFGLQSHVDNCSKHMMAFTMLLMLTLRADLKPQQWGGSISPRLTSLDTTSRVRRDEKIILTFCLLHVSSELPARQVAAEPLSANP